MSVISKQTEQLFGLLVFGLKHMSTKIDLNNEHSKNSKKSACNGCVPQSVPLREASRRIQNIRYHMGHRFKCHRAEVQQSLVIPLLC